MRQGAKYTLINGSKGWTLIEILVVMGIFFMLVGGSLISVEQVVKYENTLQVEGCKNNILTFINKSKLYCRNKFNGGDILFNTINNEIVLKIGIKYIDKFPQLSYSSVYMHHLYFRLSLEI